MRWLQTVVLIFAGLLLACGGEEGQGALGQTCYPNGTCNKGFICVNTICVPESPASANTQPPQAEPAPVNLALLKSQGDRVIDPVSGVPYSGPAWYVPGDVKWFGVLLDGDSDAKWTGSLLDGYRHGKWTAVWDNGNPAGDVHYTNGKYNGSFTTWYSNGKKESEDHFNNGTKHGLSTRWYTSGQKKEETHYKDGKKHGKSVEWRRSGEKREETHYKDGKKHGKKVRWYTSGQKEEETHYKDGKKHGPDICWFHNGQKELEIHYKDDKWHGLYASWHDKRGQKKEEIHYKDGRKRGLSTKWHADGELFRESYFDHEGIEGVISVEGCQKIYRYVPHELSKCKACLTRTPSQLVYWERIFGCTDDEEIRVRSDGRPLNSALSPKDCIRCRPK